MSVDEYITNDFPFYHITKMENLESIKQEGLLRSKSITRDGICVVRTNNEDIINEIIDTQLHTVGVPDDTLYAIIKIVPSKHNISACMVTPDAVEEPNASLYNYLCVDCIKVSEEDIIRKNIPIGNFKENGLQADINETIIDGYYREVPPLVVNCI